MERSIPPPPFDSDEYTCLRKGIFDDAAIEVYVNAAGDFAYLSPIPATDYRTYEPRVQKLRLQAYKKDNDVAARRYEKLEQMIRRAGSFLEVGAGNAGFLAYIRERHPALECACIEPDENTRRERAVHAWLRQFEDLQSAPAGRFDLVGLFHVLEHVLEPAPFLRSCAALLSPHGRLLIEVPSLTDPLLGLYRLKSYEDFFFQRQHPFYYSGGSLERLLKDLDFTIDAMIGHQRYGIENHLNWLQAGKPGGNAEFREIFRDADGAYRRSLEASGWSDAVIAIAGRSR
jgi:SAM-dependent methyltransferase